MGEKRANNNNFLDQKDVNKLYGLFYDKMFVSFIINIEESTAAIIEPLINSHTPKKIVEQKITAKIIKIFT